MIDLQTSNLIRYGLLAAIGGVLILLLVRWNEFQESHQPVLSTDTTVSQPVATNDSPIPSSQNNAATSEEIPHGVEPEPAAIPSAAPGQPQAKLVTVTTDVFEVKIDTYGGDLVKVALRDYATNLGETNNPYVLLNRTDDTVYVAWSGLVGANGTDKSGQRPIFDVSQTSFELADGQDSLNVDMTYQQDGVEITKRFVFRRNDHLIDVEYIINNQTTSPWSGRFYGQIKRDDHDPAGTSGGMFAVRSFMGGAITTPEDNYKKVSFDAIADGELEDFSQAGGWIALIQHYFLSAWIANPDEQNRYSMSKLNNVNQYLLRFQGPTHVIEAGQQDTLSSQFYAGPKDVKRLEKISPHLDKTIDFGWLWFLARPLFSFLLWIHSFVGNWGLAIILLVVCMKAAFFHLSAAGFRSMAKMRKFAPKMQELKERYGDNRQKMSEEMMKLYKKEKVNPMGGCLPMLLQMPVFIALYWVLLESVELRHAPFIFWINDLSSKDPYFVLPLIYGATFFIQQKLSPAPPDPTQAKIMQMMPIMFTFFFLFFASGLVLYWCTNGLLSIAQQYVITRQIEKADDGNKGAT